MYAPTPIPSQNTVHADFYGPYPKLRRLQYKKLCYPNSGPSSCCQAMASQLYTVWSADYQGQQKLIYVLANQSRTLETTSWYCYSPLADAPFEATYHQSKIPTWCKGRRWWRCQSRTHRKRGCCERIRSLTIFTTTAISLCAERIAIVLWCSARISMRTVSLHDVDAQ